MEKNKLFNKDQAGFRQKRSTIDQVMRLQNDVINGLNNKKYTVAIFLDLKKAFDMVWTTGIMDKMQKLGITGRTYWWVKEFLANRTFQVKVGQDVSDAFNLQNGTPQGSVISPVLFLIAINDFPDLERGVQKSTFADDSAIWKTGGSLELTTKQIQKELTKIESWCTKWGFNLSVEKTVGMVFSEVKRPDQTTIKLENQNIKFVKKTKFLGMMLDNRMSWAEHIKYTVDKCKKTLNLMRCLTGQGWGADKTSLLMIYKALIRSKIDYGCIAYNSTCTKQHKEKLDKIQAAALRICCGAMKGTPNASLQVECGEMPLELRRLSFSLKYREKIQTISNHPTTDILKKTWRAFKTNKKRATFLKIIDQHVDETRQAEKMKIFETPPWKQTRPKTNMTLHSQISKSTTSQEEMKAYAQAHIWEHGQNKIMIFTDGSKDEEGRVGAAFCSKQLNLQEKFRLPDRNSIFTAEMTAINRVLEHLKTATFHEEVVIFTDSLSAVQAIDAGESKARPNLTIEIINNIDELAKNGKQCEIHWIPSHVGVEGNEAADILAKESTTHAIVDVHVNPELQDIYADIEMRINSLWQTRWDEETKGRHHHTIQPEVDGKIKYIDRNNRRKETFLTRLRLGRCRLKHYLHQMGIGTRTKQSNTGS